MQSEDKGKGTGIERRSNEPDERLCLKTILDHKDRLLRALNYIENNLSRPLQTEGIARVACLSHYHFHRKFSYYTGNTVSDYIRNRRLAKAAVLLLTSEQRITDIAFSLGYGTSEAFTKAFKRRYGCPPSRFRSRSAKRGVVKRSDCSNLIVLKPLIDAADDTVRGIDAFWELQGSMAEVQPDCLDSTWISVFPDAGNHAGNGPAYCVEFSSLQYTILFPGAETTLERNPAGSHAVLYMNQQAIVYQRAVGAVPRQPGKSPKRAFVGLPVGLRSILLAPV